MKARYLILITTLLTPAVVFASDLSESHLQATEELLDVIEMGEVMDSAIATMLKVQVEANPALSDFEDIMRDFMTRHMSWEVIKGEVMQMYAEVFTESELRALADFYRTDVGQKSVRLMPELMAKGAQLGQRRVQENMAELQELILQRQSELQEEKTPQPES